MKVLIVSEDALYARLTAKKLENWGDECVIESSGSAAFERLKKEQFRIVIADWDARGMRGDELCRGIREIKQSQYIYTMISSDAQDKDIIMASLEAGADDYMDRPINIVELRLKVKNAKRILELEDELREGAGTDSATGLVNEASFRQFFRVILAETRRMKERGSLMYVKVDDYQPLFKEHGYATAQTLMVEISRALNRIIRGSDLVARTGDDEFCMLLQNTFWDRSRPVAEKAFMQINNMTLFLEGVEVRPTVTIGIVDYPKEDMASDEILKLTDRIRYVP